MIRLRRYLGDLVFRAVFKMAELRHPRLPARPVGDDEAVATWLHEMDVRTRTAILERAIESRQAEEAAKRGKPCSCFARDPLPGRWHYPKCGSYRGGEPS